MLPNDHCARGDRGGTTDGGFTTAQLRQGARHEHEGSKREKPGNKGPTEAWRLGDGGVVRWQKNGGVLALIAALVIAVGDGRPLQHQGG
jgi:hypothetical protein